MFQKIVKLCIYALVFLMPLFWLPFSFEAFEFNKFYLLTFLTALGVLVWLAKMIFKDKKIAFNKNIFNFFVLGFVLVMAVNIFFAKDLQSAIWGTYGRFWPSLVGMLSMAGLYFLISNNVSLESGKNSKVAIGGLLKAFLLSGTLVVVSVYFSLFGVWQALNNILTGISKGLALPPIMLSKTFNFTSGSLEGLTMFLAFFNVMLIALLAFSSSKFVIFNKEKAKASKIFSYIILVASLGILMLIDFWPAFVAMAVALSVFLLFVLGKRMFKDNINQLALAVLCVIISVLFIFTNPLQTVVSQTKVLNNVYPEILLNQQTSWSIGLKALQESPIMGIGLGNFNYGFSKYKPQDFLKTQFWQARFSSAGNQAAELLGTIGIVGMISYTALIALFLLVSYLFIMSGEKAKNVRGGMENVLTAQKSLNVCLMAGFVCLVAGQFVYYQNAVLAFYFWLVMALGAVAWKPVAMTTEIAERRTETSISFNRFPEASLVFSIIFWVGAVGVAFLYFNLAKNYLADTTYREYVAGGYKDIAKMEKASRLADKQAVYHSILASAYLNKLGEEAAKTAPDKNAAANLTLLAVQEVRKAVMISPNLAMVQETAGIIYRDIQGLAQGAADWSVKSFESALQLEPSNPAFLTEIGKLKVGQKDNEGAAKLFNQAISLKSDYSDAYMQLVALDEQANKTQEAKNRLASLLQASPFNVAGYFQLGRLYYNDKDYDNAAQNFLAALQLFPNHSNSLYSLGLIYEKQTKYDKALEMFQKVLDLNPGNADVEKKIDDVRNEMNPAPQVEEKKK